MRVLYWAEQKFVRFIFAAFNYISLQYLQLKLNLTTISFYLFPAEPEVSVTRVVFYTSLHDENNL